MTKPRQSVLPPSVQDALRALGDHLEDGPKPGELQNVLESLRELPAKLIVAASREIADLAQLTSWRKRKSLLPNFLRPAIPEFGLLEKEAGFAWLFLFHYNGRVREAALHAIKHPPTSPFFFCALAWRLNDWAEPVRLAAMQCARRVLPNIDPETAAVAELFLDRQLAWGRRGEPQWILLDRVFYRGDVASRFAAHVQSSTTGALSVCLRHALRYPAMDAHLPILARKAIQPAVRAIAFKSLIERKASWPIGYSWQWIDRVYGEKKRVLAYAHREIATSLVPEKLVMDALADRSVMAEGLRPTP